MQLKLEQLYLLQYECFTEMSLHLECQICRLISPICARWPRELNGRFMWDSWFKQNIFNNILAEGAPVELNFKWGTVHWKDEVWQNWVICCCRFTLNWFLSEEIFWEHQKTWVLIGRQYFSSNHFCWHTIQCFSYFHSVIISCGGWDFINMYWVHVCK